MNGAQAKIIDKSRENKFVWIVNFSNTTLKWWKIVKNLRIVKSRKYE